MRIYDQDQQAVMAQQAIAEDYDLANTDTPLAPSTYAGALAQPEAVIPVYTMQTEDDAWVDWGRQLPVNSAATDIHRMSQVWQQRAQATDQIRALLQVSELGQLLPTSFSEDGSLESVDFTDPVTIHGLLEALNKGVAGKEVIDQPAEVPDESAVDQQPAFTVDDQPKIFAPGALIPRFRFSRKVEGKDYGILIGISGQNPTVTAIEASDAVKDKATDTFEQISEMYRARKGKPDRAAAAALTYTCMELVLQHSEHNNMASSSELESIIRREQPSLLQDEPFKLVLRGFNADPERFREDFARHSSETLTQIVMTHPARAAFLKLHGIEIKAAEGDHEQ
jgi:hypothetical protein